MVRTPDEDLKRELQDPEYTKYYGASDCKAEIAITLCKARQASGKTQQELADSMSFSQPYIAKLEGGEANPTIGTIGSILAVLGCRLVTNTMPLIPEPELNNFKVIWSAAGTSANDSVIDGICFDAVTTISGWAQNEIGQEKDKIAVGGAV